MDLLSALIGELAAIAEAGIANFAVAVKPAFAQDPATGLLRQQGTPSIYFAGTNAETAATMQSAAISISFASEVCPPGYVLTVDAAGAESTGARPGACTHCQAGTYSVDPLAGGPPSTPACFKCPVGGTCDGSGVTFAVGVWRINTSMYILQGCPPGHRLFNSIAGVFSHDAQQCLPCLANQYILNPNSSRSTCQNCPSGALCDGNALRGAVEGSKWVVDPTTDSYVLQSCPPRYTLVRGAQDYQE